MNEYFANTLTQVLEETSATMADRMTMDHLNKYGSVTLEESSFYTGLCHDVITEAAEDFIPDELDIADAPMPEAPVELWDAAGNKFLFQDGSLIPVDDTAMDPDIGEEVVPDDGQGVDPVLENTNVYGEMIEESTVVAKILANLK